MASANSLISGQRSSENGSTISLIYDDLSQSATTNRRVTRLSRWQLCRMTAKAYRAGLAARMKAARAAKGYTQAQVGAWLGIGRAAYQKHEERGNLPPHLFEHFAVITDMDLLYLVTGQAIEARLRAR